MKCYTVWKGRNLGVFNNWKEAEKSISGFPNALYKGFPDEVLATNAFYEGPAKYLSNSVEKDYRSINQNALSKKSIINSTPIENSFVVDGACQINTGKIHYRGLHLLDKREAFNLGPLEGGTNNIAEYLAIVKGLKYLETIKSKIPIYSDSNIAIDWVRTNRHRSMIKMENTTPQIINLLKLADSWLNEHPIRNEILKWQTKVWGENPADFGNK